MRYPKEQKARTRERLIAKSCAITKKEGFGTTGVDTLMAEVGLTAGAFYSHFPSKQALFHAVVEEEIKRSYELLAGDPSATAAELTRSLKAYLSVAHASHPDQGCVLPTLGAEIARAGPEVRETVEHWMKRLHGVWHARTGDADAAWALMAQCVGALLLSRVMASDAARAEVIAANFRFATQSFSVFGDSPR